MSSSIADAGTFDSESLRHAIAVVDAVLLKNDAWCNLEFESLDDSADSGQSLFGFLAARGPANPLATIMGPSAGRSSRPVEVGIQHQAGVKAARQLVEAGIELLDGGRVIQDHPRRGLVVRCPDSVTADAIVSWLFPAMRELSRAPRTGVVRYATSVVG